MRYIAKQIKVVLPLRTLQVDCEGLDVRHERAEHFAQETGPTERLDLA
jgi:hypothetical protein